MGLSHWQESEPREPEASFGKRERRTQSVLRAAIEKLNKKRYDEVGIEEVELVRGAAEALAGINKDDASSVHLKELLDLVLESYNNYAVTTDMTTAQVVNGGKVVNQFVAKEFFGEKKRQKIKNLAGIEVGLVVRRYELTGPVELTGDVPDGALLVVRDGSVAIDGFVAGDVVASGDIVIQETVHGGWIISTKGDIKARRILAGSTLIAQTGGITCSRVESPKVVFARKGVVVEGDVRGGKLYGRTIRVAGTVNSAELNVVSTITAKAFETNPPSQTVVRLCRMLTSEDYGRPLDESSVLLTRLLLKHNCRLVLLAGIARHTQRDVHNCIRTMLYYLLAGVDKRSIVCELRGVQSRVIHLEQILEAGGNLRRYFGNIEGVGENVLADEVDSVAEECLAALVVIENQIEAIPREFAGTHRGELLKALRLLRALAQKIRLAAQAVPRILQHLRTLDEHFTNWNGQLAVAATESDRLINEFGLDDTLTQQIEGEPDRLAELLTQSLEEARRDTEGDRATRADSTFMRLMQRQLTRQRTTIGTWQNQLAKVRAELQDVLDALDNDPLIVFDQSGSASVRAEHFDKGVILTASPVQLDGVDVEESPMTCLEEPVEGDTTFTLHGRSIRRETPERRPAT
ncbi:MAG: polymer-forming cytoskeletal protein [Candidatus Nealsonbacteria bacterium]|nr:polymer-forming cytoskeletal protein [Candidatus Nealsonbacteria bacterium]